MNAPITQAWRNIARRLPVIANVPTPREPQAAPSKYEESALLRLSDDGDLLDPRHSDELPEEFSATFWVLLRTRRTR